MKNNDKTKEQLLNEIGELNIKITEMEKYKTEHKQAKDKLLESEEIFKLFIKDSPIYIFFKDNNIRSIHLSKNYEKMLGRPINELLGKSMDELFPSDLAKKMIADDIRILNDGIPITIEEEINNRIYETTKFPIQIKGKNKYLAGYTIDITDRKLAEEELLLSITKLNDLYHNTPVMMHSIDAQGKLLSVSKKWLEVLGYDEQEVIGVKSTEYLTKASKKYANEIILPSFFKNGYCYDIPYQYVKKNGEIIDVLLSAISEKDDSGKVFRSLAVLVDVTARKQAEEKLKSRNRELEIWAEVTTDRELKMLDLKKEINELLEKSGERPKYEIPI